MGILFLQLLVTLQLTLQPPCPRQARVSLVRSRRGEISRRPCPPARMICVSPRRFGNRCRDNVPSRWRIHDEYIRYRHNRQSALQDAKLAAHILKKFVYSRISSFHRRPGWASKVIIIGAQLSVWQKGKADGSPSLRSLIPASSDLSHREAFLKVS